MGIGRFQDGKFDLILTVRHDADAARIEQWERSFRRASEILYDATDGQMQFGRVYIANNSAGSAEADAYLLAEEGVSSSSVNALGSPGFHMNLKADERNKPYIVIHEFGHYGLGVYDEYTGPGGSAECTDDASTGACIMEFGWELGDQISDSGVLTPGVVNEFCAAPNHDPDNDTSQEAVHGEPCWQTIQDLYPGIVLPLGLPDAPVPAGHDPVEWILLNEEPRFALVLDRSGSMAANDAIAGVRYGADYWVNYLAQTGDWLSIVTYSSAVNALLPLTLLTPMTDLGPTTTAIAGITASGLTNIGGGMDEGVSQMTSLGDQAATQVMILFTDGLHNTGTPPEDVLPDLVANGIRAYTIGFGPGADQVRLQQIAEATGGSFEQIDPLGSSPDAQLLIQNTLIQISGEVRDGSGIVTTAPGLLPEPPAGEPAEPAEARELLRLGYDQASLQKVVKLPLGLRPSWPGFAHRAHIEAGSARATFVVSHREGTRVRFYVVRPDGTPASPADQDVTFVDPPGSPYAFYVVDNPEPGFWVMRVMRGHARGAIPFKVFAFSEHKALHVAVDGVRQVGKVGDQLRIRAQATYDVPLTGLRNPVLRLIPDGAGPVRGRPKSVILRERPVDPKSDPDAADVDRVHNGVYEGVIELSEPGSYTAEVLFVNPGTAGEAVAEAEPVEKGDRHDEVPPPPVFVRTRRFQIHAGPLSPGKDVESDGAGDCEQSKRCLEHLLGQLPC